MGITGSLGENSGVPLILGKVFLEIRNSKHASYVFRYS